LLGQLGELLDLPFEVTDPSTELLEIEREILGQLFHGKEPRPDVLDLAGPGLGELLQLDGERLDHGFQLFELFLELGHLILDALVVLGRSQRRSPDGQEHRHEQERQHPAEPSAIPHSTIPPLALA